MQDCILQLSHNECNWLATDLHRTVDPNDPNHNMNVVGFHQKLEVAIAKANEPKKGDKK